MIHTKCSPLVTMFYSFIAWFFLAYLAMMYWSGDIAFAILIYSFYLAPVVCFVSYNVVLFFNRPWARRNKAITYITETILIGWAGAIIVYIMNLFV